MEYLVCVHIIDVGGCLCVYVECACTYVYVCMYIDVLFDVI
jgi:hypothetical protein